MCSEPDPRRADLLVGHNIGKARAAMGLSLVEVARRLDILPAELEAIEAGAVRPTIVLLQAIAKLLCCRLADFFAQAPCACAAE
jgi:transcriptional regulator with XRE-family HTH domain